LIAERGKKIRQEKMNAALENQGRSPIRAGRELNHHRWSVEFKEKKRRHRDERPRPRKKTGKEEKKLRKNPP